MHYQINDGIDLNVFSIKKFKNISITIDFITPVDYDKSAFRTMTAEMMETSNADFPKPSLLSKKLSFMYGAIFGTNVFKYGNQHILRVILNLTNEKYLPGNKSVLKAGISFLYSVIFKPLLDRSNRCFDNVTFKRQQINMINYLNSLNDDKQFLANMQLRNLYYAKEINHKNFLLGTPTQIKAVNSKNLYQYYLNMINHDQIQINVLGDVNLNDIKQAFDEFAFKPRTSNSGKIIFHPSFVNRVQTGHQFQNTKQGKLALGYYLPVFLNDNYYYAALLFNALLGGTPQSKLFLNIREKRSLAYYVDSSYNALSGMILIESGINSKNKSKVMHLIKASISELKNGDFSDSMLQNAKADLINDKISSLDDPKYLLEENFVLNNLKLQPNIKRWCKRIKAIAKEDIIHVARLLQLKAVFFVGKEDRK